MKTTHRILATATGLAALAAPVLTAGPAAATISTVQTFGCTLYAPAGCIIAVDTTGTDATTPVTVSVGGVTIGTATPTPDTGLSGYWQAQVTWTPPKPGYYTITATQGTSTSTTGVAACAYPSGQIMFSPCTYVQGSVESPSAGESVLGILLFPLSAGS